MKQRLILTLFIISYSLSITNCFSQTISTVAGIGTVGFNGDGIAATSAELNGPYGVALDVSGNIYIADNVNHRIRKVIVSTGIITTIAGTGIAGFSGDGGAATSAQLNYPAGMALDASGNIYIVGNHRIRKVTVSSGIISTLAGTGIGGYNGDGIAATAAQLYSPIRVAVDNVSGNIYIADQVNHRIRKITVSTGIISTVAGTGTGGYNGDGIAATSAQINSPHGVALDASGNIYIAELLNHRIRKVTVSTGIITTVAGNGTLGFSGDGGVATVAQFNRPSGVALDASGNIYIVEWNNQRIRKVTVSTGIINTVAGTGVAGFNGDGIPATSAQLNGSVDVALDASGNIYISDYYNNRIRKTNDGMLPIELLSFTAECKNDFVELNWSTASELNNDYFTIERSSSSGGGGWEWAGKVKGAGNSSMIRKYEFIDPTPALPKGEGASPPLGETGEGVLYYRLKQTDFNGQYEYFQPVPINCFEGTNIINIFPNPFSTHTIFTLSKEVKSGSLIIYDIVGKEVRKSIIPSPDNNIGINFTIERENLSSGVYFLKIVSENKTIATGKLIVSD